jgi:RNA polymerase sigma-70 factor (ECF subfamily)
MGNVNREPTAPLAPVPASDAYRHYGAAVYSVLCHTFDHRVAEDVTEDVFVRLSRHPETFDPSRGSLRTFLLQMAHTQATDFVRSQAAHNERRARGGRRPANPPVEMDDQVVANGRAASVARAIAALPPPERAAIVVTYYGQCTYREAAIVLDQPEGTIKSRIRNGMSRLRPVGNVPELVPGRAVRRGRPEVRARLRRDVE